MARKREREAQLAKERSAAAAMKDARRRAQELAAVRKEQEEKKRREAQAVLERKLSEDAKLRLLVKGAHDDAVRKMEEVQRKKEQLQARVDQLQREGTHPAMEHMWRVSTGPESAGVAYRKSANFEAPQPLPPRPEKKKSFFPSWHRPLAQPLSRLSPRCRTS